MGATAAWPSNAALQRPGTGVPHRRAAAVGGEAVSLNQVAVARDQRARRSRRSACLRGRRPARAGCRRRRSAGPLHGRSPAALEQHLRRRVRRIGHLVVAVKRRHVPRDVRRDAGEERGQPRAARRRESLKPGISSVTISTQNRIACSRRMVSRIGCEPAAELAVVAVVEALEIDLVEIDPRPQVLEHLRRAVAVRDEAGRPARPPSPP